MTDKEKKEKVESLRTPFCRQGNKYPLRDKIIPLFPPHKIYVEPFAGSSAIFFNKPKADKTVLNDLDKDTIKRLNILKRAPKDKSKYRQDLNTFAKIKHFFDHHSNSPADLLLFEKIKTCHGFSGLPAETSKRIYKDYNPIKLLDLLDEYQEKLKGVILTNEDYEKVIKQYDSPSTLFFIDPPYEDSTKSLGYAEDKKFDFERLNSVLKGIKGHFLMTINNSPRVRRLFSDFVQKPVDVLTGWGSTNTKGFYRKELFISNYTMGRIPSY